MTMYAVLHPKSDVDRLLFSREKGEGAGGLISAEEYVKGEVYSLSWCLKSHGKTNARCEDGWNTGNRKHCVVEQRVFKSARKRGIEEKVA